MNAEPKRDSTVTGITFAELHHKYPILYCDLTSLPKIAR
jgi:hypothetical protein